MAKELNIVTGITGQTMVATPYLLAAAQTPISMTEYGTTGAYWGDMEGAAGVYEIVFSVSTVTWGAGEIDWDGTAEVMNNKIPAKVFTETIEDTLDLTEALRLILAATAGSSAGAGTGTFEYLSVDGVTTRIQSTFDSNGNRQITLLDAS